MKTKTGVFSMLLLLLITGLLLNSCASTRLTSAWKGSTYSGGSLKNVLVVGVLKDPRIRRVFVDTIANDFKKQGVEAVSLSATLPKGEELTAETIAAEAKRLGVENIFVSRLISVEDKDVYHPPHHHYRAQPLVSL